MNKLRVHGVPKRLAPSLIIFMEVAAFRSLSDFFEGARYPLCFHTGGAGLFMRTGHYLLLIDLSAWIPLP
jgi:hypothetical protein